MPPGSRSADRRRREFARLSPEGLLGAVRRGRSALLLGTALQASAVLLLAAPPVRAQPAANARPSGGVVSSGSATIGNSATTTTINQTSPRASINWQTFNVGSQQTVDFVQPSASAVALNRVLSSNPSLIAGHIDANGQIILINQSGVIFTHGAQVNTAGLIVSAAGMSDVNFMAGKLVFDQPGNPNAAVVNRGTLTVRQAGLAALVAPRVANSGVIDATLGHVVLAGAKTATLDLYGDGLLALDVTNAVTQAPTRADGKPVTALVTNTGVIEADGGTVQLTAREADGLVQNLVQAGGRISANSVGAKTGTVVIGGLGGSIVLSGEVTADGTTPGSTGGQVVADASQAVALTGTARVSASGPAGGGTVAIGTTPARAAGGPGTASGLTAQTVQIAQGASIAANATDSGNGGRVTVLSSLSTSMAGSISAKGGPHGGNGGIVEVSGGVLSPTGLVNTSAPLGKTGMLLLDPTDLTIDAAAATSIDTALAADTNVTEMTTATTASGFGNSTAGTGNINVDAAISWSTAASLTLSAYNNIIVSAPITASGAGALVLTTNNATANPNATLTFVNGQGSAQFTGGAAAGAKLSINGAAYTLLYDMGNDATGVQHMNGSAGNFALAIPLDATASGTFAAAPVATFSGNFNGLGNTISNLTINSAAATVGLFGTNSGVVANLGLVGGAVTATATTPSVGALAAQNNGTIINAYTTGAVTAANGGVGGGLVGQNNGTIKFSHASGPVASFGAATIGGLVGSNNAAISSSYATGPVTGAGFGIVGGLVGLNGSGGGTITDAYATGTVNGGTTPTGVGGLVGINDPLGTITDAYATGAVIGTGTGIGGLVGTNLGAVTDGYWDTGTTGQMSSGAGTPETTAQLQSLTLATALANPANWGIVSGISYPYLASQFPTGTPQVVAGTVFNDLGVTPAGAGITVNGLVGGAALTSTLTGGAVATGANGYYYYLLAPNTIPASGAVLTYAQNYVSGTLSGAALADQLTGSATNLNIFSNTLHVVTPATAYSTVLTDLTTAEGGNAAVTTLVSGLGNLAINASSSFDVDASMAYAGGKVILNTLGAITQTSGSITAQTLTGGSVGGATLTQANLVDGLGPFSDTGTANTTGLSFKNQQPLHIAGAVSSTGPVTLTTTNGDLILDSSVTATGQTVTLSSAGRILQSAGAVITAATLNGGSVGGATLTQGNAVGTLGPFGDTGNGSSGLSFKDAQALATSGTVSSTGQLTLTTTTGGLTLGGNLTATGQTVTLSSAGAILQNSGSITATTLTGGSVGGATLTQGNAIGTLTAFSDTGAANTTGLSFTNGQVLRTSGVISSTGPLTLKTTSGGLTLGGNVTATGQTVTLSSQGAILANGVITAATLTGGSVGGATLTQPNAVVTLGPFSDTGTNNTTGLSFTDNQALATSGAVSSTGPLTLRTKNGGLTLGGNLTAIGQTVTLISAATILQNSGIITAATLTGSSVGGTSLTDGNLVTSLSMFADTGAGSTGILFTDAETLGTTGAVSSVSGPITLTTTGAGSNLTLGAAVTASGNTVTLDSAGTIDQTAGSISAGILTGSAISASLASTSNGIVDLGPFTATGGNIAINDAVGLTITGLVNASAGNVYLEDSNAGGITFGAATVESMAGGTVGLRTNALANLGVTGATGVVNTGTFELSPDSANPVTLGAPTGLSLTNLTGITAGTLRIGAVTQPGNASPTIIASAVTIGGTSFDAAGTTVLELDATAAGGGTGAVTQTGSLINVGTLTGTAASYTLTTAGNTIAALGSLTATGGNIALVNEVPLALQGIVTANSGNIFIEEAGTGAGDSTLNLNAGSLVVAGGTIGLVADALAATAGVVITAGATGLIEVAPLTPGTPVDLGGPVATAGTLLVGQVFLADLAASGELRVGGYHDATGTNIVTAGSIDIGGAVSLAVGAVPTLRLDANGPITESVGPLSVGTLSASTNTGIGDIDLTPGSGSNAIGALGNVTVGDGNFILQDNIATALATLDVPGTSTIYANNVTITNAGTIVLDGNVGAAAIGGTLSITATNGGDLDVGSAAVIGALGVATLAAAGNFNTGGVINAQDVTITAGGSMAQTGGVIAGLDAASGDIGVGITVTQGFSQSAGTIFSNSGLTLAAGSIGAAGSILAVQSATLSTTGAFAQTGGLIAAGDNLSITTPSSVAQSGGGSLSAGETLTLASTGAMTQSAGGGSLAGDSIDYTVAGGALPDFIGSVFLTPGGTLVDCVCSATPGQPPGTASVPPTAPGLGTSSTLPYHLIITQGSISITNPLRADWVELHTTGNITENGGSIVADLLTGSASAGNVLLGDPTNPAGSTSNQVTLLGSFSAAGTFALNNSPALTVLGGVSVTNGGSVLLAAPALTVDRSGTTYTISNHSQVAHNDTTAAAGMLSAPALVQTNGSVTPGEILLRTDSLTLTPGTAPNGIVVNADDGLVAIVPLTAGNTIDLVAAGVSSNGTLVVTQAMLNAINTADNVFTAGSAGTETLLLGSQDGINPLAGAININTGIVLSGSGSTNIARNLVLEATGTVAENTSGGLTVVSLAGISQGGRTGFCADRQQPDRRDRQRRDADRQHHPICQHRRDSGRLAEPDLGRRRADHRHRQPLRLAGRGRHRHGQRRGGVPVRHDRAVRADHRDPQRPGDAVHGQHHQCRLTAGRRRARGRRHADAERDPAAGGLPEHRRPRRYAAGVRAVGSGGDRAALSGPDDLDRRRGVAHRVDAVARRRRPGADRHAGRAARRPDAGAGRHPDPVAGQPERRRLDRRRRHRHQRVPAAWRGGQPDQQGGELAGDVQHGHDHRERRRQHRGRDAGRHGVRRQHLPRRPQPVHQPGQPRDPGRRHHAGRHQRQPDRDGGKHPDPEHHEPERRNDCAGGERCGQLRRDRRGRREQRQPHRAGGWDGAGGQRLPARRQCRYRRQREDRHRRHGDCPSCRRRGGPGRRRAVRRGDLDQRPVKRLHAGCRQRRHHDRRRCVGRFNGHNRPVCRRRHLRAWRHSGGGVDGLRRRRRQLAGIRLADLECDRDAGGIFHRQRVHAGRQPGADGDRAGDR